MYILGGFVFMWFLAFFSGYWEGPGTIRKVLRLGMGR
jgi:hypothetical protein